MTGGPPFPAPVITILAFWDAASFCVASIPFQRGCRAARGLAHRAEHHQH